MGVLFKSKREREREARQERRRAKRQAENCIADVKERVTAMQKDAEKHWTQAREALKGGQKAAAQRFLTGYRAAQVLMTKLAQKRWVFEQYLAKIEVAQTDQEIAAALESVNKVTRIDPDRVADVFEASRDLLGEQLDAERFWDKMYHREMDGATGELEDRIPTVKELGRQLEDEAAAEVGGGAASKVGGELDARIQAGQERVKKLLDGK